MDAHTRKVYVPMTETGFYILYSLREPNHGYGVVQNVERLTDGEIKLAPGTMYGSLAKMEKDAVSLIHDEDAKVFYIVVKKDINEDPYYLETLTEEIIYLLKGDEYDKFLDDTAKALDYTVNDYAVNQFKVKKIYDGSEA